MGQELTNLIIDKYVREKLGSSAIGKQIKTSAGNIERILVKNGIQLRTQSEAAKIRIRLSRIPELNDKNWLIKKYVKEKNNTYQIGKLLNISQAVVYRALKKHNIKLRNQSEARKAWATRKETV